MARVRAMALRKLRVRRVDLVDRGASYDPATGVGASVLIYKRDQLRKDVGAPDSGDTHINTWAPTRRYKGPSRKAQWSGSYVNDLPDSAFAWIQPGGKKDSENKTTPRSLRHLPYKDANGKLDPAHVRNALARLNQTKGMSSSVKDKVGARLRRAAASLGIGSQKAACGEGEMAKKVTKMRAKRPPVPKPKGKAKADGSFEPGVNAADDGDDVNADDTDAVSMADADDTDDVSMDDGDVGAADDGDDDVNAADDDGDVSSADDGDDVSADDDGDVSADDVTDDDGDVSADDISARRARGKGKAKMRTKAGGARAVTGPAGTGSFSGSPKMRAAALGKGVFEGLPRDVQKYIVGLEATDEAPAVRSVAVAQSQAQSRIQRLEQAADRDRRTIAKLFDDRKVDRYAGMVKKHFVGLPGVKAEPFARVLKAISERCPEEYKKLWQLMKAWREQIATGALFTEVGNTGSDATGSVEDQVEAMAQTILADAVKKKADTKMTIQDATAEVFRKHPDLYKRYTLGVTRNTRMQSRFEES